MENLTEDDVVWGEDPYMLILVGEEDRCKREEDWDEKVGDDEAKEEDDDIVDEQNLPEGEWERWWRDVVTAIVVWGERK